MSNGLDTTTSIQLTIQPVFILRIGNQLPLRIDFQDIDRVINALERAKETWRGRTGQQAEIIRLDSRKTETG